MTQCVAVVGGGLVGLLSAAELHLAGFAVQLFEARRCAREASWAGGGILCPLAPWDEPESVWALAVDSMNRTRVWAEQRLQSTGIDLEYWRCGMRVEDAPPQAGRWARSAMPEAVVDDGALWMPSIAQLRTPRYGRAMAAWLRQAGVLVHEHSPVRQINVQSGTLTVGHSGGERRVIADHVVVSAGPWSAQLLRRSGFAPPLVRPVRGQMLLYAPPASGAHRRLRTIIRRGPTYLIPRRDGRVLVGSTLEDVGFDARPTAAARTALHEQAIAVWPGLADAALEGQWAGLRPAGADAVPLTGAVESQGSAPMRLWLNTGHFRNGVTLAAGSARQLAHMVARS